MAESVQVLDMTETAARHSITLLALLVTTLSSAPLLAEEEAAAPEVTEESSPSAAPAAPARWFERLNLRGYTQFRYNRLGETNPRLVNLQGDRSIGGEKGFMIRRARLILFGDLHERVSVYLQPDFVSGIGDQQHVVILRDWYTDIYFDSKREFRLRIGQSKVPYGFENMQSSQNRLALDRNDGLNSAVRDERDLGAFFYWAPAHIRTRFAHLVSSGLKGSGDYGVLALGVFNGQNANQLERNDNLHAVARVTWPFLIGNQFLELSAGGYTGMYHVRGDDEVGANASFRDARVHGSIVLYPQPFGFQAEYTAGIGPALIDGRIRDHRLNGGYAMVMYKHDGWIPFVRAQRYDGGRKHETNAHLYRIRELELGLEWLIHPALELTGMYVFSDRTHPGLTNGEYVQEAGRLVRLQLQVNY